MLFLFCYYYFITFALYVFLSLFIYLSDVCTQHGAQAHDPEISNLYTLPTEATGCPYMFFLNSLRIYFQI